MLRPSLCAIALLTACSWGSRAASFAPARGPSGASVALRVTGENADRRGELYASDSAGVMLRTASSLLRVAWERVAAMDVAGLGLDFDVRWGETVSPDKRRRLALASRFPQGLDGDLLKRVLDLAGLQAVEEIR